MRASATRDANILQKQAYNNDDATKYQRHWMAAFSCGTL